MDNDIQQILITEEQIRNRIAELGRELTAEYAGKNPVIVGVLKGVVVFYADMVRQIKALLAENGYRLIDRVKFEDVYTGREWV